MPFNVDVHRSSDTLSAVVLNGKIGLVVYTRPSVSTMETAVDAYRRAELRLHDDIGGDFGGFNAVDHQSAQFVIGKSMFFSCTALRPVDGVAAPQRRNSVALQVVVPESGLAPFTTG